MTGMACDRASDKRPSPPSTSAVVQQQAATKPPSTAVAQGIRLTTIPESHDSDFSIFDEHGAKRLREQEKANAVVAIEPGRYVLKQAHSDFVYASNVVVKPGETTVVAMGAIKLTTVPDTLFGDYHIFDESGQTRLREDSAANVPVTAPPGRFVLTQKYSPFPYAAGVLVKAGEVTVVEMGAFRYSGPHDYHVFDAAGAKRLREHGKPGELVTAPPGHFVLKKAYTDEVLAADVVISAGVITEVR
jgi:hypothetical protein